MTAQPPTTVRPDPVLPAAVLWDMDGTIIDTEPIWQESQVVLTARFGAEWTHEDGLSLVGSGLERSGEILRAKGVDMEVEQIVAWMTDFVVERLHGDDLPWRPGARELVEELHDRGVPTALVTMSRRTMALVTAEAFGARGFRVVVAGDDVERPKPYPDAYLSAAAQLGVDPTTCIAIEDSATGVASAVASGAVTVGVEHIVPLAEGACDVLLDTLDGVTVDRLLELTGPALAARATDRQGGPASVTASAPVTEGDAR
ncbi:MULTISPECIES: HAD family phosphatase [unclassified Curtobacterium]|uniref:HAD family hydrolase n=1 Tax=unclassified Curtobacterium TaxID=257496 RepID=UPI0021ACDDA7|nr:MULTISPECIES: HAD family hydrolase [unclassified Curtobacterium]